WRRHAAPRSHPRRPYPGCSAAGPGRERPAASLPLYPRSDVPQSAPNRRLPWPSGVFQGALWQPPSPPHGVQVRTGGCAGACPRRTGRHAAEGSDRRHEATRLLRRRAGERAAAPAGSGRPVDPTGPTPIATEDLGAAILPNGGDGGGHPREAPDSEDDVMRNRELETDVHAWVAEKANAVVEQVQSIYVGPRDVPELMFNTLLARGHLLLEGVPGVAKTTLVKAFSATLGCEFRRIQFTPDLLPADITGTYVLSPRDGTFELREGAIFANVVLGDE